MSNMSGHGQARSLGLNSWWDITPIMEDQMKGHKENEVETAILRGLGFRHISPTMENQT